jgi:AraC-like DNA-binding protein
MTGDGGGQGQDVRRRVRTRDVDEAEGVLEELYLPVQIVPIHGAVDLKLDALQLETMTAGRLSYGHHVRLLTAEAEHYHVNVPLSGYAVSRSGSSGRVTTSSKQAAVFVPRQAAAIDWANDCVQLCLMIRPSAIELEVEQLLGRSLLRPLAFERVMDLTTPIGRTWRAALDLLLHSMDHDGVDLATHAMSRRHLERLLLEGLLLGHHHNYTDALLRWERPPPRRIVAEAMSLLEERFPEPWSVSEVARAVGVSVRSLQEGFKRDIGVPPMAYLQTVRLRHTHKMLLAASSETTSVSEIARGSGFTHLGRFAQQYRFRFGDSPSVTLQRRTLAE